MQNYCNIVKNKLNMLIRNMEKNVSDFVVDPKRDFIRKSELSFSKTMRFILGMGSQTLGKELMEFYDFDPKMVSVSAWYLYQLLYSEDQRYFRLRFNICSINSPSLFLRLVSFMDTDFMLLMVLIYIFRLYLMITIPISQQALIQMAII